MIIRILILKWIFHLDISLTTKYFGQLFLFFIHLNFIESASAIMFALSLKMNSVNLSEIFSYAAVAFVITKLRKIIVQIRMQIVQNAQKSWLYGESRQFREPKTLKSPVEILSMIIQFLTMPFRNQYSEPAYPYPPAALISSRYC